jgi:hypothetical protein
LVLSEYSASSKFSASTIFIDLSEFALSAFSGSSVFLVLLVALSEFSVSLNVFASSEGSVSSEF